MLATNKKSVVPPAVRSPVQTVATPYVSSPPVALAAQTLTLLDVWRRLWRQKWVLLLTFLTVLGLTAYLTWTATPSYRAAATIQIEKQGIQIVDFGTLTRASPDMGEQDPFFRTQYEQLKSRKLAERVIQALDLQTRLFDRPAKENVLTGFVKFLRGLLSSLLPTKTQQTTPPKTPDYTQLFAEKLYIEPIEKTHLVKVFFESPDPALSAEIVNTLVDSFIKDNINSQSESDTYAQAFLEQELAKARDRLTLQEAKLVEYAKQNGILEVNNSQSSQERKLDELYSALAEAERNRIQAESQLLQGRKHGNVREVLNNPVVESLKKDLVTLEAEYREKLKLFKPEYPDMQLLQGRMDEVRTRLQQEIGSLKQSLQAEFAAAKKLEDDLRSQLAAYKKELVNLRDSSIEYNALKREVETSRNLYDGLLQRKKEVSVAANATSSNIRVVDAAAPNAKVFRPKKALNLIIGGIAGLLLGVGLALLRETLRQSVTSVEELQTLSGLPVLGTIPHARHYTESRLALVSVHETDSLIAEAYRVAAANLRFVLPGGHAPRITLLTSVNPAEGKSTSALNIAFTQAQQGMKVLLIDADLRRPTVHVKLGLPNARGLNNYLNGEADIAAITHPARDAKGLYFIMAGTPVADPVRLLSSPALVQLLNLAVKHFDSVIIDGPPVAGFADALYLSYMAEATVIVADEERINRKRLLTVIEQLQRVKPNVVGFLMVKAHQDTVDERYYKHYYRKAPAVESKAKAPKGKRKGLNLAPAL